MLTFDCYGTLIDWESGILEVLRPWARRRGVKASDEELLSAFAQVESVCQQEMPQARYPEILGVVQARIGERFQGAVDPADAAALADSVRNWRPFSDTVDALARLRSWHKLVVVSNIDRVSFAHTQQELSVPFDSVVTAEEAGAYKPDVKMFHRALAVVAQWSIRPGEVLHVAQSLFHDHQPAKMLGLKTVWVNRRRGRAGWGATPLPATDVMPDLEVGSLAELVALENQQRQAA